MLDTHIWVWLQEEIGERVEGAFLREVEDWQRSRKVFLSAISVWEIAQLVSLDRLALSTPVEAWVRAGTEDGGFQLLPLSTEVLIESTRLPGELHRDPADQMLLATAMAHELTLVTRDKALVRYGKQGFAKVIKR